VVEERLLHDVLGGGLVADQHEREPHQAEGVQPEQVIDRRARRQGIGLRPRASPVCGDRHAHRTFGGPGMLIPAAKSGRRRRMRS
jgi:hypothetical protein